MYKLIFVMSDKYGFGDNIKGLITCYLISKMNKLNFNVNCSLIKKIDVSTVINNNYLDNSNISPDQVKKFVGYLAKSALVRYLKFNLKHDILKHNIYILTNIDPFYFFFGIWDKQIKLYEQNKYKFIYDILDEINGIFLFNKMSFVYTNYDVLHLRLGDKYFDSTYDQTINYDEIIKKLNKNNVAKDLVVLSDNKNILYNVVDNIKNKINHNVLIINDNKSVHFNSMQNNDQYLALIDDFNLLFNADTIYGYGWSGFSFYGSLLGQQKYVLI